ncbi:uncharacterized protein BDR25DRAFT_360150 [Lindgomyces ingoldianus]|uniref:Uncharacterized protein n=1 Tax=Lindgomyces ingoldianus TaxID=673940 RepID=A0ACB6QIN0_9PLEO|nr:uncharacterized protein BDR25DRAFT_360150 [Lindgomyces ingoldianus]KAF2465995.1 hypothetical protein BDR25DRAFT_360150 [Lindgomyces ingoldianus]
MHLHPPANRTSTPLSKSKQRKDAGHFLSTSIRLTKQLPLGSRTPVPSHYVNVTLVGELANLKTSVLRHFFDILEPQHQRCSKERQSQQFNQDLLQIMHSMGNKSVAYPCDKIFALLGLTGENDMSEWKEGWKSWCNIDLDYSKTVINNARTRIVDYRRGDIFIGIRETCVGPYAK